MSASISVHAHLPSSTALTSRRGSRLLSVLTLLFLFVAAPCSMLQAPAQAAVDGCYLLETEEKAELWSESCRCCRWRANPHGGGFGAWECEEAVILTVTYVNVYRTVVGLSNQNDGCRGGTYIASGTAYCTHSREDVDCQTGGANCDHPATWKFCGNSKGAQLIEAICNLSVTDSCIGESLVCQPWQDCPYGTFP